MIPVQLGESKVDLQNSNCKNTVTYEARLLRARLLQIIDY